MSRRRRGIPIGTREEQLAVLARPVVRVLAEPMVWDPKLRQLRPIGELAMVKPLLEDDDSDRARWLALDEARSEVE